MCKEIQTLPHLMFKSFEIIDYAKSFIAGNVRFSTLKYFREIEDANRKDKTEGMGQAKINGEVLVVDLETRTISSQPGVENLVVEANLSEHLICCFSICESGRFDDLPRKFGRYCVRVNDPAALFRDLAKAMTADPELAKNPPILEADQVRYDKDAHFLSRPGRDDALRLAWTQKPTFFSDEFEFRSRTIADCLPAPATVALLPFPIVRLVSDFLKDLAVPDWARVLLIVPPFVLAVQFWLQRVISLLRKLRSRYSR